MDNLSSAIDKYLDKYWSKEPEIRKQIRDWIDDPKSADIMAEILVDDITEYGYPFANKDDDVGFDKDYS